MSLGQKLNIDLAGVPFVGDKESDALAALSVGARPILVKTGTRFPETRGINCEVFENLDQVVRTFVR